MCKQRSVSNGPGIFFTWIQHARTKLAPRLAVYPKVNSIWHRSTCSSQTEAPHLASMQYLRQLVCRFFLLIKVFMLLIDLLSYTSCSFRLTTLLQSAGCKTSFRTDLKSVATLAAFCIAAQEQPENMPCCVYFGV